MNREIKFRQENNGKWHYWGYLKGGFYSPLNGANSDGKSYQYTGLKDKNGKEIYEGDILEHKTNYEPYKCIIKWSNELGSCGCCYDACDSVGFVGEILPGSKYNYSTLASEYEEMEVIGNIYENPELIK